jgi:hypothetical protein
MGGCRIIIGKAWSWTIVGSVFVECHDSCTLNISLVNSLKELGIVAATRDYIFRSFPNLHTFPVAVKACCPGWPILPLLLYRFYTLWWSCSRLQYSWNAVRRMLSNDQSINFWIAHSWLTIHSVFSSVYSLTNQ